jgi:hypothetical protein
MTCKPYDIPKTSIWEAWLHVKANQGGLLGMAKAFVEISAAVEVVSLGHHEWLGSCSTVRRHGATTEGGRRDCALPNCVTPGLR